MTSIRAGRLFENCYVFLSPDSEEGGWTIIESSRFVRASNIFREWSKQNGKKGIAKSFVKKGFRVNRTV